MSEGRLDVRFTVDSYFLEDKLPWEVRDAQLRLAKSGRGTRRVSLPAGIYQVSAVLPDGREHSQVIQLVEDATQSVVFDASGDATASAAESITLEPRPTTRGSDYRDYMTPVFPSDADDMSLPLAGDVVLTQYRGAALLGKTGDSWYFGYDVPGDPGAEALEEVPTATLWYLGATITVSLPVNPREQYRVEETACIVTTAKRRDGIEVRSTIPLDRTVANALQNMLASGRILEASGVLDDGDVQSDATELLLHKYRDPVGAGLGAIVLRRIGKLEGHTAWLRNLARSFEWMPDGRILLAEVLAQQTTTQSEALDLLLSTIGQRPMFTDCLSVQLGLLRRWPDSSFASARRDEGLARVLASQATVDWDAVILTDRTVEPVGEP